MEKIEILNRRKFVFHERDPKIHRRAFRLSNLCLPDNEGIHLMQQSASDESSPSDVMAINTAFPNWNDLLEENHLYTLPNRNGLRLHLVGLGDVGGTLLTALRLKADLKIATIGIYDKDENKLLRYEQEINQIYSYDEPMPDVIILSEEELFACDIFVFTVAAAVPSLEEGRQVDVRMIQLEKNKNIMIHYARLARKQQFKGLFAVLSDPVDPLCQAAYIHSNLDDRGLWDNHGLGSDQIRGFGLGVMNARAAYYAKKRYPQLNFSQNGRAFGPHGKGLLIVNDIFDYDPALSDELTNLAETANLKVRDTGYKPYIAPAISSGCMSLLYCLHGSWHYSSTFIGGVFFGCRNRMTPFGNELEQYHLPQGFWDKVFHSYETLRRLNKKL